MNSTKTVSHRIVFVTIVVLLLIVPLSVFAHSGNTDSRGGHHVSGTDEYHYHHGYPAHQHPNGVCPYSEYYSNATKPTSKNNDSDFWIVFAVILGFPVVAIIALKIYVDRNDAKKRAVAIIPDFMVWYLPSSTCYHSSKSCSALQNAKTVYWATDKTNTSSIYDRKPCVKCCYVEDGKIHPKNYAELPSMLPVISSNLKEVGYHCGSLYVLFHNGSLYRYYNVPQRLAERLMTSRSAGKFFNNHIRDHYDYEYVKTSSVDLSVLPDDNQKESEPAPDEIPVGCLMLTIVCFLLVVVGVVIFQ